MGGIKWLRSWHVAFEVSSFPPLSPHLKANDLQPLRFFYISPFLLAREVRVRERERKRSVTDSPAVLMGQGGDVEAYLSYQTTHAAGKSTCASSYDSVLVRTGGGRSLPKTKNREDMCNCCFDICETSLLSCLFTRWILHWRVCKASVDFCSGSFYSARPAFVRQLRFSHG